ncbi:MAG TPA: imidazoleglycerol-phosphate dehydratase HisB [Chitinispirillaceae bacterium]|jgi:imidazoleglycerol-phosphate dehydratase|nr:imidazoleglycerol-phosphate dehydratase HisB [Chitinispirillaceae bacterium]
MTRKAKVERKTRETDIVLELVLDGSGNSEVSTGNGFMDHMMVLFSRHGLFDLKLTCKGDTHIDFHHSAEDIGICLGAAFSQALGDFKGITRYGTAYVPMDESLARVCIDIAGRPNLVYSVELTDRKINDFDCDLAEDFFKAFTDNSKSTIHVDLLRGRNSHHSLEAVFKAFGRALSEACAINPRAANQIPSTKGVM